MGTEGRGHQAIKTRAEMKHRGFMIAVAQKASSDHEQAPAPRLDDWLQQLSPEKRHERWFSCANSGSNTPVCRLESRACRPKLELL